jgi:non-ribosomal peptide synthase protein (TIGR01720 family)
LHYGLLKYLSEDAGVRERMRRSPQPQLLFNYLGQFGNTASSAGTSSELFEPVVESKGRERSPRARRSHPLEVTCVISGGVLQAEWSYSTNLHRRETIENLAHSFINALRRLIRHCQSPEAGAFTPSDFPLLSMDQWQLDCTMTAISSALQPAGNNAGSIARMISDLYPLSPMQQGMLFQSLSEAEAYVEQMQATLKGYLDKEAFQQAWQQVIDRHPILRTGFIWEGVDTPLQFVAKKAELNLLYHDWRGIPIMEHAAKLREFLAAERSCGFPLATPPLMRIVLLQTADDEHFFVWTHHHLLLDGWSVPIVLQEVLECYEARQQQRAPHLTPRVPYRNYIAWLQQRDHQEIPSAQMHWQKLFEGIAAPTSLSFAEKTSVTSQKPFAVTHHRNLSEQATAALQSLARQQQLTLNTLVQGAWALLLAHFSGEPQVIFGAVVSGRPAELPGAETMVGMFINTLPMVARFDQTPSLMEWLKQFQQQQADTRNYEHLPVSQVQGWSGVPRTQSLFESIVVFENYPVDESLRQRGGSVGVRGYEAVTALNAPLTLEATPGKHLHLELTYDGARFDEKKMARMMDAVDWLLQQISANAAVSLQAMQQSLSEMQQAQMQQEMAEHRASGQEKLRQIRRRGQRLPAETGE